MEANVNVKMKKIKSDTSLSFISEHIELLAAIVSGVLTLFAWFSSVNGVDSTSIVLYLLAFAIGGFAKAKEGIEETLENKKLNVELLMVFAAIGSAIIGHWVEGAILIFIFALSGALETYTTNKSKRELSALMSIQPEQATLLINGEERTVHVSKLQVNDLIVIKPGERIPADGVIINGNSAVDESTITGESIPVEKSVDEEVFAGTMNINGSITVKVTKENTESLFHKILKLVQSAQSEKSPSQQFIEKFEGTYVNGVLIMVVVLMFLPQYALGWSFNESFYRAMVFMVVASPCALVASIMPATLSAISNGARNGLLFKGGVHLERLSKVKVVAFDKTGTLTKGEPKVTDVLFREGINEKNVLNAVYAIEKQSNHPLAKAIVQYIEKNVNELTKTWINIEEHSGFGVVAKWNDVEWKIGKAEFVGKEEAFRFQTSKVIQLAEEGKTIVYVKDEQGIVAIFALKDVLRDGMKDVIRELQKAGIHTVMLTGDSHSTAKAIAKDAGITEFYSECLPEDKVKMIKKLKEKYQSIAMIGDGINDAPALAIANVGIAMGEGTDVALETAEIVLMKNDISKVMKAISLSKRMNRIIKQNIVFSLSVIALLICSNFFQMIDLPFGVVGHEGSTILVILNGLRLLKS